MSYVTNNNIVVDKNSKYYDSILKYFFKFEGDESHPLYSLDENSNIIIGIGLYYLLPDELKSTLDDYQNNTLKVDLELDYNYYRNLLDGITLRDDQIISIIKCIRSSKGISQLPTGSGKSLIIAGVIKYYYSKLGYYPDCLILEPTTYLLNQMLSRFKDYGIPSNSYRSNNRLITGVTITHPMSVYNDIKSNSKDFSNVSMFIGDEFHHCPSNTWKLISDNLSGAYVRLGFSASMIEESKLPIDHISKLSYDELVIISCTGNLINYVSPSYYIKNKILATPIYIRMHNQANQFITNDRNWQLIRSKVIESDARQDLASSVLKVYSELGFKSLILVDTKNSAYKIIKKLYDLGVGHKSVCSFGGGSYKLVDTDGKIINSDNSCNDRFDSGDLSIMIATSHLYEGADINNLDVVVLFSVGKQSRRLIQGVGRSLRKTKTGKYAYIIDFTDDDCKVLKFHSDSRLWMCKNIIGISDDMIYSHVTLDKLSEIILNLEK